MNELAEDSRKLVKTKQQTGSLPEGSVWEFAQIGGVTRVLASSRELALRKLADPLPIQHGNWSRVYVNGALTSMGLLRHIPTNTLVCPDDLYFSHIAEECLKKLALNAPDENSLKEFMGMVNRVRCA